MKSRHYIQATLQNMRKTFADIRAGRLELPGRIERKRLEAWIKGLDFVLRHYNEQGLRETVRRFRVNQMNLPALTGGDITKLEAVMKRHELRHVVNAIAWCLQDETKIEKELTEDKSARELYEEMKRKRFK